MFSGINLWALAFFALGALGGFLGAYLGKSAHRHRGLERRLKDLEVEAIETQDRLEKLTTVAKRKYNRDAVAAHRERKKNGADVELTDDEWKKQMNLKLATGEWRPSK